MVVTVEEVFKSSRAEGPATILTIGMTVPQNKVDQSTYPDYYFRITKSEHKTELKEKFQRLCDKSQIKARYMYLTEEEPEHVRVHGAIYGHCDVAMQNIPWRQREQLERGKTVGVLVTKDLGRRLTLSPDLDVCDE